ncbi:hypothetical protein HMPREF1868_01289 [Olsenella sp. DNF00959]|nr:hypothetical protein HMPREF1868_01289 [Olsenella sp. DNF00959]
MGARGPGPFQKNTCACKRQVPSLTLTYFIDQNMQGIPRPIIGANQPSVDWTIRRACFALY